jgi:hypothetical protein
MSDLFLEKKIKKSSKIMLWKINLSLLIYTFCDNWTKIMGEIWHQNLPWGLEG